MSDYITDIYGVTHVVWQGALNLSKSRVAGIVATCGQVIYAPGVDDEDTERCASCFTLALVPTRS